MSVKRRHELAAARVELNAIVRATMTAANVSQVDVAAELDIGRSGVEDMLSDSHTRHLPFVLSLVGPRPLALALLEHAARRWGLRLVADAPALASSADLVAASAHAVRESDEAASRTMEALPGGVSRQEAVAICKEIDEALARLHELRAAVLAAAPEEGPSVYELTCGARRRG
jgi:hypothetical protein